MGQEAMTARLQAACDELGLHRAAVQRLAVDVLAPEITEAHDRISELTRENKTLLAELEQLRTEREQCNRIQAEMLSLLNAPSPAKLVHELRNVLNELTLLKALCGDEK